MTQFRRRAAAELGDLGVGDIDAARLGHGEEMDARSTLSSTNLASRWSGAGPLNSGGGLGGDRFGHDGGVLADSGEER